IRSRRICLWLCESIRVSEKFRFLSNQRRRKWIQAAICSIDQLSCLRIERHRYNIHTVASLPVEVKLGSVRGKLWIITTVTTLGKLAGNAGLQVVYLDIVDAICRRIVE